MRFGSVCSGMGAAEHAWQGLGWECSFMSEIEQAPRAVLQHHYPGTPLHGNFTTIEAGQYDPIDLLVGGTPCQDLSIGYAAGTGRAGDGFNGERSGLATDFARLAERSGANWVVWENVPNALSAENQPGLKVFLSRLADIGLHVAWRVLDSADFGTPDQPRRRLYVVGSRGNDGCRDVLFKPEGADRNLPPVPETAPVLTAKGGMAYDDRTPCILDNGRARVTTPREWESALGFPKDYTLVPYRGRMMADGPRWTMLGNSMAVNVMTHIGRRIQAVESIDMKKENV